MYAYISPPVMVHLSKPAHYREVAFTDKTGGCNSKADVVERMYVYWPSSGLPAGEPKHIERNRWCCPHYKTNQSVGMRKGSV